MKILVFGLALANATYFLWSHGVARPGAPVAAASPATLKLASEAPPPPAAVLHADTVGGADPAGVPRPSGQRAAPEVALLTNVKRCLSVGPFREVAEAAHTATALRGRGYDPRQRVADGEVWAGVWVYLPRPANPAAGDQLIAKLKEAGIDDALEMPGPVDGSVVSLGLFSEQRRAKARVAQVQALGLNPALADRKHNGNVYWIDIDLKPTDALLDPAELQGEAGRISRVEVKACPAAAASS